MLKLLSTKGERMPSNNIKYSMQFKEQTVLQMLDKGVSASSVAAYIGVNLNTVCRWVREHRKLQGLPTYHQQRKFNQAIKKVESEHIRIDMMNKRHIVELEEEIEILKKFQRIFMQPQ
jgi:transposase-like protein